MPKIFNKGMRVILLAIAATCCRHRLKQNIQWGDADDRQVILPWLSAPAKLRIFIK